MTERGILFSAPMVRALLDGSKTQTRRVVKPVGDRGYGSVLAADEVAAEANGGDPRHSPYGQPGDHLWVRETFFAYGRWEIRYNEKKSRDEWRFVDMTRQCSLAYQYAADNPGVSLAKGRGAAPGWHRRPALFMPRAVSRILLDIVSVRVERLQAIGEPDAIAEGVVRVGENDGNGPVYCDYSMDDPGDTGAWFSSPVDSYRTLWEQINGAGSWNANPWVWVVELRRTAS
jgi:hypothetical protein